MPWIAVSDLLLTGFCEEVGCELYEMDKDVRNELLKQLKQQIRLGADRLQELADFVLAYVDTQFSVADSDANDFAQGQRWAALAYRNPEKAAQEIATVLAQLSLNEKSEWMRMAALLDLLEEPLVEFRSLILYARAIAEFVRGNMQTAATELNQITDQHCQLQVAGIQLPLPQSIHSISAPSQQVLQSISLVATLKQYRYWLAGGSAVLALFAFLASSDGRLFELMRRATLGVIHTTSTQADSPTPTSRLDSSQPTVKPSSVSSPTSPRTRATIAPSSKPAPDSSTLTPQFNSLQPAVTPSSSSVSQTASPRTRATTAPSSPIPATSNRSTATPRTNSDGRASTQRSLQPGTSSRVSPEPTDSASSSPQSQFLPPAPLTSASPLSAPQQSLDSPSQRILVQGEKGQAVSDLQDQLRRAGCFNAAITGSFDLLTREAVIRCQKRFGLKPNGIPQPELTTYLQRGDISATDVHLMPGTNPSITPTTNPVTVGTRVILQAGDEGTAVSKLQDRLRALGCFDMSPTGFFGSRTRDAVIRCQQQRGINADGVVTVETDRALGLGNPAPGTGLAQYGDRLQLGDHGPGVSELQIQLRSRGYYYGEINGVFGSDTRSAVIQLQRDLGRSQTGVADADVYAPLAGGTTPPTTPPGTVELQFGDQGQRVSELQQRLNQVGYSLTVTGYFGTQTQQAVLNLQQARGLSATGVADNQTLAALGRALIGIGTGQSASNTRRYSVIIPFSSATEFRRIEDVIPDAVPRQNLLGDFVRAGSYTTPEAAERQANALRSRGLTNVQVIFE